MKPTLISTVLSLLIIIVSCSSEDNKPTPEPVNEEPNSFSLNAIANNEIDVVLTPSFNWTVATDPDGDTVSYDLYLDENSNPTTLIAKNITTTSYQVQEHLSLIQQYYWKIIAKDGKGGMTQSDEIYSFTTRNVNLPTLPITDDAEFSLKFGHATVVFDDKLWLIGGSGGVGENDVWYTSDGVSWIKATENAAFSGRLYHTATVFDNKMWVIGGYDGNHNNDVWFSSDGSTWTKATENVAFSKRNTHTTVVFDNKMWVIGGFDVDNKRKNDVWYSSDGITWIQATDAVSFSKRSSHTTTTWGNKMWVIAGGDGVLNHKNDIWYSSDGSTWTLVTETIPFSKRGRHTATIFNNKMWIIAGIDTSIKKDIWVID